VNRIDQGMAVRAAEILGTETIDQDLRSVLRGLPVMIRTNGFAMTCVFLLARSKTTNDRYWKAVTALLADTASVVGVASDPRPVVMLDTIAQLDGQQYLLAEHHGRLLAGWLARLADALYEETLQEPPQETNAR
jgi:CRISPR-associated protein (Cas_Cmr5)